jgi:hypothetical protein
MFPFGRRASLTEITPADPLADYSRLALWRLRLQALDRRPFLSVHVTWVVVADQARATIFAVPRGMARLREVIELESGEESAEHGAPQVYGFAAELALYLDEAQRDGRFDELILVAAPTFLRPLRDSLNKAARDAVVGEIGKNLIGAGRETLQEEVLRVL